MSWRADELDAEELEEAQRTWVAQYAWVLARLSGPVSPVDYLTLREYRDQVRTRVLEIEREMVPLLPGVTE